MAAKRQPGDRARAVALKNLTPLINELHDLSQDLTLEEQTQTPEDLCEIANEVRVIAAGIDRVAQAWWRATLELTTSAADA